MKNSTLTALAAVLVALALAAPAFAMDSHASMGSGPAMQGHEGMQHGSSSMNGMFKHAAMVDGMHAEFEVMSLASMNMSDPQGRTHHVMATFSKDGRRLEKLAGKVKLIAPSGKEQVATLKDFGGGQFAANFTIDEPGKWGMICLFKDEAGKHVEKFWYDHMAK